MLGYVYTNVLPLGFLRSLLTNVGYVAVLGGILYQVIDNAAHLGGLMAGLMVGMIGIDKRKNNLPLRVSRIMNGVGLFAGIIIILGAILCARVIIFGSV